MVRDLEAKFTIGGLGMWDLPGLSCRELRPHPRHQEKPRVSHPRRTEPGRGPYDDAFYSDTQDGASTSARVVLRVLFEHVRPDSILDVGCGRGDWLAAAGDLGVGRLVGMEGDWVSPGDLVDGRIELHSTDLKQPPAIDERFDLCMSLEVAEHLPPESAGAIVDLLCSASDLVLFSAAIPEQGGTHHIHEAWQSEWVERFDERGYRCSDLIRPIVWDHPDVEWWYRQNVFVFVRRGSQADDAIPPSRDGVLYDVVHPLAAESRENRIHRMVEATRQDPPLSDVAARLTNWIRGRFRRILGRGRG